MWIFNIYGKFFWSTDGVNWTEEAGPLPWSGGAPYVELLVFKNKMWSLGSSLYDSTAEVWYTDNGNDWLQATDNTGWGKRSDYTAIVYNNKIWVMGGRRNTISLNDFESLNDVWNSEDGVNWKKISQEAEWETRHDAPAVVYKGKMWIIAGSHYGPDGKTVEPLDDVWYYSEPTGNRKSNVPYLKQSTNITVNTIFQYPGNANITISYSVNERMPLSITVFDITGRTIKLLWNGQQENGLHSIIWDGTNCNGRFVNRKQFIVRFESNTEILAEKFIKF